MSLGINNQSNNTSDRAPSLSGGVVAVLPAAAVSAITTARCRRAQASIFAKKGVRFVAQ